MRAHAAAAFGAAFLLTACAGGPGGTQTAEPAPPACPSGQVADAPYLPLWRAHFGKAFELGGANAVRLLAFVNASKPPTEWRIEDVETIEVLVRPGAAVLVIDFKGPCMWSTGPMRPAEIAAMLRAAQGAASEGAASGGAASGDGAGLRL